ncbi:MAG: SIS domain-containing protein [Rhodospirillales bacterium]|nr:SIS domain-containing protein [Rhodospirillales bacterium]
MSDIPAIDRYFQTLARLGPATACTDGAGGPCSLARAIGDGQALARATHARGNTLLFIGNGGSAGIASHLAIDYSKNGNLRALALNDGAALTCLGNDLGFENVFAKQIEFHGRLGDLLVAISSSGRSPDILKAVETARARQIGVITLSGFTPDNPLRRLGDLNFYVDSGEYGFVEILHMTLLHAILDLAMGWKG